MIIKHANSSVIGLSTRSNSREQKSLWMSSNGINGFDSDEIQYRRIFQIRTLSQQDRIAASFPSKQ